MKEFDLEKALAGEPVKLRNGRKAYIKYSLKKEMVEHGVYTEIQGYILNEKNQFLCPCSWTAEGKYSDLNSEDDIIGMWEEVPKERNKSKNTINQIENWFKTAVPDPTDGNKLVQIGCHLEEVCEMLDVFGSFAAGEELNELSGDFKKRRGYYDCAELSDKSKIELLDALCDQIVTAIGVAYMFGMDIQRALKEVADSNDSKFDNGRPVFNEQGKIAKGKHYFKPNLETFIGS
ncbi:hypothetical protein MHD_05595 [Mannheimia granulomatis]|uniref:nucleoside triphosphate pyrophosphohydrolase family protein n=1 Tax=Mannheimia granulomatis TaxID=85402 RepID=UPI0004B7BF01|nr:nucleoside triphosphate pyrophosphohydrolase family protein [Mannheimia granulomatis]RGE48284.1 hypothetical protein MHD_05595 [Mannheimia granulomatis]